MKTRWQAPVDEPICPLCSAGPYRCDHAVLRWSHLAHEYEDSWLEKLARTFEGIVRERMVAAWERGVPPQDPVLGQAYQVGLPVLEDEDGLENALCEAADVLHEYVFDSLRVLPGIVVEDDGSTMVFYAADRESVWNALDDRIRALEIEMDRDETEGETPELT